MATAKFFDRYVSTLASSYTSGGTSLSVASAGSGASALPTSGDFYVVVEAEASNTEEVLLVTSVSGTTLTVAGAKAGTSASNHASGATIRGPVLTAPAITQMKLDIVSSMTVAAFDTETTSGTLNPAGRAMVYLSDAVYTCVWTGSAWEYYWQSRKVTRAFLSDFSTTISSTATAADSGGILITGANSTAAARVRNLPASSNYRLEIGFEYSVGNENYGDCGMILRASSDQRLTFVVQHASGYTISAAKLNAGGGFNANYFQTPVATLGLGDASAGVMFFALVDDGTNRIYYASTNGKHWLRVYSVSRTDFMTPTAAGFSVTASASFPPSARFFHWSQA